MTSSDTPKGRPATDDDGIAGRPVAPEPGGTEGGAMLRFTLVTGAWFVGLFGLMRLPWVERVVLTPFAEIQQRVADQLTGAPSDLVYADASCSGRRPAGAVRGSDLRVPGHVGCTAAGRRGGFHAYHRRERRAAGQPVAGGGGQGAARPAARLRLAGRS